MEAYLICDIAEGMFSDECSVSGEDAFGEGFSLFSSHDFVFLQDTSHSRVLLVEVLQKEGDLVLIRLPSGTFENGSTITVRQDQLYTGKVRQEA
jgi:hypothetical protein